MEKQRRLSKFKVAIAAAQIVVFTVLFGVIYVGYNKVQDIESKLVKVKAAQEKLIETGKKQKEALKAQTEWIKKQADKLGVNETQINAIRRSLSNQATEINRLDNVTVDLSKQQSEIEAMAVQESQVESEPSQSNKKIVEMPILENYQINIPKSQKVIQSQSQ